MPRISDLRDHAQRLFNERGPAAMAVAARRALACERRGEAGKAHDWRRIEAIISELRGPPES